MAIVGLGSKKDFLHQEGDKVSRWEEKVGHMQCPSIHFHPEPGQKQTYNTRDHSNLCSPSSPCATRKQKLPRNLLSSRCCHPRETSLIQSLSTLHERITASSLPLFTAHILCWNRILAKDPTVQRSLSFQPLCANVVPFCTTVAATLIPLPQAQYCKTSTWSKRSVSKQCCHLSNLTEWSTTACSHPRRVTDSSITGLKIRTVLWSALILFLSLQHCTKTSSYAKATADAFQLIPFPLENWLLKNTINFSNSKCNKLATIPQQPANFNLQNMHTILHLSISIQRPRDIHRHRSAQYSLEMVSDSGLLADRSSTEILLPSAPTPHPRGPMAVDRLLSWISSEIISRFFKAVLYSPFARASFACRSSTVFFSC